MSVRDLVKIGSKTAKDGFRNEDDVVKKFNNWKNDADARKWLTIMNYNLNEIERIVARKIRSSKTKTDVQVQISIFMKNIISAENISVKLVSNNKSGFNQADKRWVDDYKELWNIPKDIVLILKLHTGETIPSKTSLRDARRMYFNEMTMADQNKIIIFFKKNKILIISDIIMGRGDLPADWMLVVSKQDKDVKWILKSINETMNIFGNGDVYINENGNLYIGKVKMQRKGGDGGRKTANMLQFKINPLELFKK
ncbi:MAG: type II restriction endonuclease [Nanoarchaeota archaeon]|nr:type II restriction endonuclease [Nanoarchaeota archaeon]MBU4123975.1 type II restriction endonuclease [Nanoarchaeota archaeon]